MSININSFTCSYVKNVLLIHTYYMGKIKILQEEKLALFGNNRQSLLKVLVNVILHCV